MAITFAIQTGHPQVVTACDTGGTSLSEAIEAVFPLRTEFAILVWNGVFIPLHYKYDVSEIIRDLLDGLVSILENPNGSCSIEFPSSSFSARWDVQWRDGRVQIRAQWLSVIGDTESILSSRDTVECDLHVFLAEWKGLLVVLSDALARGGYDAGSLRELNELRSVISRIPGVGYLYGS